MSNKHYIAFYIVCFIVGGILGYIGAASIGPFGVIPGIVIAFIINYYVIRPLFFSELGKN